MAVTKTVRTVVLTDAEAEAEMTVVTTADPKLPWMLKVCGESIYVSRPLLQAALDHVTEAESATATK